MKLPWLGHTYWYSLFSWDRLATSWGLTSDCCHNKMQAKGGEIKFSLKQLRDWEVEVRPNPDAQAKIGSNQKKGSGGWLKKNGNRTGIENPLR